MKHKTINPSSLFDSTTFGFSQVVVSKPGKLIFVSGQVAWDEKMNIVGGTDLSMQCHKAIDNIELALESAGGSLESIVRLNIYKVNYQDADGPIISAVLRERFGSNNPPASSWIGVERLANKGFLIEIEVTAVL